MSFITGTMGVNCMKKIGTHIETLTEEEIRGIFKEEISSDEQILWQCGATARPQIIFRSVCIAVLLYALIAFPGIGACTEEVKTYMFSLPIIMIPVCIGVLLSFEAVYPRYYVITNRQVGYYTRGVVKSDIWRMLSYDEINELKMYGKLEEHENYAVISVVPKDSETGRIELKGLNYTDCKRAAETLFSAFEEYKERNSNHHKADR